METYYGLEPRTAKVWADIYRRIYTEENCIAKSRLYPLHPGVTGADQGKGR